MATHQIRNLSVAVPSPVVEYAKRDDLLEGASQTTALDLWPVVITSGLVVVAADPVTALFGFACRPGNNDAGGISRIAVIPAFEGLVLIGNHLDTDGTDNTLVQADIGALKQLNVTAAIGPGSTAAWHLGDSASTTAALTIGQAHDYHPSPTEPSIAAVGDVNARLPFVIKRSVLAWA